MVLHAENFIDRGWVESSYISTWMPYSNAPYAHHPPLAQFLNAAIAWIQGGATAIGTRLIDYVAGMASVGG